jgi:hypothetical protein
MTELLRGKSAIIYGGDGVFLASQQAAGITGTMTNVTCGLVLR